MRGTAAILQTAYGLSPLAAGYVVGVEALESQVSIEGLKRLEESLLLFRPGLRLGGVPLLLTYRGGQRPIEKVAHVGQNLQG